MTASALAQVLCLVSGIFGRPAWDEAKCAERAEMIGASSRRHGIDPVLMVAHEAWECDMLDRDAPVYRVVSGRKKLVGYDACPMGVRVIGVERRARLGPAELYEMAAARLARWKRWCERGHPGKRYPGHLPAGHHYSAHFNQGNPTYSYQVLAVRDALLRRTPSPRFLTERALEHVRRIALAWRRAEERP